MRMQIGEFLIRRLNEAGIRHLFGLPGDFNLSFLEQVEASGTLEFIGNCNELNAAYAADGYARTAGIGAVLTTFGVGDLGAISGIAGAYSENVPMVHITGAPPLHSINSRALLHHTLADGAYGNIGRCMAEFTVAQARITPANAVTEIDRVLKACWQERRPVHLQLPSDITHLSIETPEEPLVLADPASDPGQLERAAARICAALQEASHPAILVDADAGRFGVADIIQELSEKCAIPCAALPPAKGVLDESTPLYLGTYIGAPTLEATRRAIEQSDCLIGVGLRFTDSSTSLFSQRIAPEALIALRRHDLSIGDLPMPGVTLREVLLRVLQDMPARPAKTSHGAKAASHPAPAAAAPALDATAPLTHATLWPRIQAFLKPCDVIIGEAGTSNSALGGMRLPAGASYIAQPVWGAIGYTLPALFGSQVSTPWRRHLLFIGDGSFQLTAQELSSIQRRQLKPIIFLINNKGYTIERLILGENSAYNDIADWNYAGLPQIFAPAGDALTLVVQDVGGLEQALAQAEQADKLVFIELKLPMMDAPPALPKFAGIFADFDYGECGPRNPSASQPAAAQDAAAQPAGGTPAKPAKDALCL
ncbi:alpha-keto acid decarboxylase family protein [Kerstersia sp.]|uniref:alpha-keto acid decarboxylase family protein n=1 Tax=Kerstersia sp. TaxID=1930783 RepID=UPI003F93B277